MHAKKDANPDSAHLIVHDGPYTDEERAANTEALAAQWEGMKAKGTLHGAWEYLTHLNTQGMNRKQRRAYLAKHPNPYPKGDRRN